jgi:hypothetical protein
VQEHSSILTPDELRDSFYYPACGTDFRPLIAFADLATTFIYADWHVEQEEVVATIAAQFPEGGAQSLRLLDRRNISDDFPSVRLQLTNRNRRSDSFGDVHCPDGVCAAELFPAGFDSEQEGDGTYLQQARQATGVIQPWAHEFLFEQHGDVSRRTIRLLYFSDEALARYCVLYLKNGVAPRFVCTLNASGGWTKERLEEPGGAFERFLLACEPRPDIWIRNPSSPAAIERSNWNSEVSSFSARLNGSGEAFAQQARDQSQ